MNSAAYMAADSLIFSSDSAFQEISASFYVNVGVPDAAGNDYSAWKAPEAGFAAFPPESPALPAAYP